MSDYIGDFIEEDVLNKKFNSVNVSAVPFTIVGAVVSVYKDSATGTESTAGVTLSVDFDGVTGKHNVEIDTDDAFYTPGSDYYVALTAGTVDGVSVVGAELFHFSIKNRFGIPYNVWEEELTGNNHGNPGFIAGARLRNISGIIFAAGVAQSGGNNSIQLAPGDVAEKNLFKRARVIIDVGTGFVQENIITSSDEDTDMLTVRHPWLVNPDSSTEYIIIPAQVHASVVDGGYDNGFVYFITGGDTGTEEGVNGISTNPVGDEADAYTIMAQENLTKLQLEPGSVFVLPSDSSDKAFTGSRYLVDLNGQEIGGSQFTNCATVFGTALGATGFPAFLVCGFADCTMAPFSSFNSGFFGTITFGSEGDFTSGSGGPVNNLPATFDFNAALDASTLGLPDWKGEVTVKNMGQGTGSYVLNITGSARLILDATCVGGTVNVFGPTTIDDSASSGMTIVRKNSWNDLIADYPSLGTFGKAMADMLQATVTDIPATLGVAGAGLSDLPDIGVNGIDQATAEKITDILMRRHLEDVAGSINGDTKVFQSFLGALYKIVNTLKSSGGTLTIHDVAGNPFATQTLTTDTNAEPITETST